jgi:adenylosuccinate lyase
MSNTDPERAARSWKAEWIALPEVCQLTGASVSIAAALLDGLEVHAEVMAGRVLGSPGMGSERVLSELAGRIGKHRAQGLLHDVLRGDGTDLVDALTESGVATADEVRHWLETPSLDAVTEMVDEVCRRGAVARGAEPDTWS